MLYFAYGSNLCLPRLTYRVPSTAFVSVATLKGETVEFWKRSTDQDGISSGKATLVQTPSSIVYGAVFSFEKKDLSGLRRAEGFPHHYEEIGVTVQTSSGPIEAMTYRAMPAYLDRTQTPFQWYVDLIYYGGRNLGLPPAYLSRFQNSRTKPDPDVDRDRKERSFLVGIA